MWPRLSYTYLIKARAFWTERRDITMQKVVKVYQNMHPMNALRLSPFGFYCYGYGIIFWERLHTWHISSQVTVILYKLSQNSGQCHFQLIKTKLWNVITNTCETYVELLIKTMFGFVICKIHQISIRYCTQGHIYFNNSITK